METSGEIITLARWQVAKEALGRVVDLVTRLRASSLAEPGCLGYEVFGRLGDPQVLLLVERYRDQAALDAHRDSPHYKELVKGQILPLLVERHLEMLQMR